MLTGRLDVQEGVTVRTAVIFNGPMDIAGTVTESAVAFNGDILNFVVPTRASLGGWWSGRLARHFPGNDIERGAYLGVPTLVILGWFWIACAITTIVLVSPESSAISMPASEPVSVDSPQASA